MKWVMAVLVLFLAPGLVQGKDLKFYSLTIGALTLKSKELVPRVSRFLAFANEDIMNVQMDVRVYIAKDQALDERTKGHCYLRVGRKTVANMQDHLIYGKNGPEVCVPYLKAGDEIDVFIIWNPEAPTLHYTTTTISNPEKSENSAWAAGERPLWSIPEPERLAPYRALSLDDVCETFTAEALKGSALPRT